ncbi:Uncharacterised protein [Streptococcus pneumoniae]|nr:Uncharacterised protein [Streptococcus pneumoniae]
MCYTIDFHHFDVHTPYLDLMRHILRLDLIPMAFVTSPEQMLQDPYLHDANDHHSKPYDH